MMYDEFNRIAGQVADPEMYNKEIEPMYLFYGFISKREVAALYWGEKPGYYDMWLALKNTYLELRHASFLYDSTQIIKAARRIEELEKALKALKIK